jgi:hypothetical protein
VCVQQSRPLHMQAHMCMCALDCVCVCARAHERASVCVIVNICEVSWFVGVFACMYQRLCMCVCAHVLVCVHVRMCVCRKPCVIRFLHVCVCVRFVHVMGPWCSSPHTSVSRAVPSRPSSTQGSAPHHAWHFSMLIRAIGH